MTGSMPTTADLDRMEAESTAVIDDAVDYAEQSPIPHPSELMTNVFTGANA